MLPYNEGRILATKKIILQLLDYVILKNLSHANYLYGIMNFIKEKYCVNVSQSSVIGVLKRLEKNQILKFKIIPSEICNRQRKVYTLTVKGKIYFETIENMLKLIL